MHELGITRNLVAIVGDAAQGRRVRRVWLEIGTRSALLPEAVRFCFDVVRQGTALEAAELEIVAVDDGWQCGACGSYAAEAAAGLAEPATACTQCGAMHWRRRSAEELNVKAMEVESCA
jgi:hydrogenase nickel incorporation protein HypA/HybF